MKDKVKRKKILHIINSLDVGGAEMMLFKLISKENSQFKYEIISLSSFGKLQNNFNLKGIKVYNLNLNKSFINLFTLPLKLFLIFKKTKPEIIQGWMYHGNIVAFICKYFFSKKSVLFFNVRQSFYGYMNEKYITRILIKYNSYLSNSNFLNKIIYNSLVSKIQHEKIGYSKRKGIIIGNAFDTDKFKTNSNHRNNYRRKNNIINKIMIGNISRSHPMKDHDTLLEALSIVVKKYQNAHLFLYGLKVDNSNNKLKNKINDLNLNSNVHLMGSIQNTEKIIPAFDLSIISSRWGEGFSNFLGESLSCGVVCIATDIGDSKYIINDKNLIVKPNDKLALSRAIIQYLNLNKDEKRFLSNKMRDIMLKSYTLDIIFNKYFKLYQNTKN